MKQLLILTAVMAALIIPSCTKDKATNPNACTYLVDSLRYNGYIKQIIETKCATSNACHVTGGDGNGDYTTYSGILEKINSGAFKARVLNLKDMPTAGSPALDPCEFQKMKDWYEKGAPE